MWCVCGVVCVVVWCGVLCVVSPCVRSKTPPCVRSKRPRVYRHHARMCYDMRAWCRYTRGRFESTHGGFLDGHTGERRRGERGEGGSPSVLLTKKSPRRVLTWPQKFTERNPWFLPIRSLRAGREQHVPESSNHPLYLIRLFSFRNLEETPTQQTQTPTQQTQTQTQQTQPQTQHTHTHQHILTDPPTHRPTQHHSTPLRPLSLPLAHAHANANVHVKMHM